MEINEDFWSFLVTGRSNLPQNRFCRVDKCIITFFYFRDSSEVVTHSADAFAPVAYLRFLELHLEDKASKSNSQ